ncbi:MAG: flagellin FliC [Oligoflexia bacterium]|nr:flagellin FliC [Oligoflexia bacterium]
MGLRINTNVASINAQRNLDASKSGLDSSLEKLSSGQRINKAGDDAAGLAVSEKLKAQIRSLGQAKRNANDGISMIQVAEGGLNEVSNILIRLRELSIQAASDTVGDTERGFINVEYQQLKQEIQRISQVTEFNGTSLLTGEGPELEIQVGVNNNPFEDRIVYPTGAQNVQLTALGIEGIGTANKLDAQGSIGMIDTAIVQVNANRANLGAMQNRLSSTVRNISVSEENMEASNSRIRDVDVARETSNLARNTILNQAGVAVLSQANQSSAAALKLIG